MVYRALDVRLERTVALKLLPDHLINSAEDKERALREARTASSLDHPNIGAIYGFEETSDGRVFIVLAYYEGETLAQKLVRGPLPVAEAVDIAIEIAEGLAAAHAGAVMHRDIKPSNVIVTRRGAAKIVDFGLARLASATGSTRSVSTAGTIGYMSPEQTMGKVVDQRTDLWSLGIVLAEMVGGKNPFHCETAAATVFAIINEAPHSMDEVPVDLQRIIYKALSKQTDTRYQSAREMLADLVEFRRQVGDAAEQASFGTSSSRASGRASLNRTSSSDSRQLREQKERAARPLWGSDAGTARRWRWAAGLGIVAVALAAVSLLPPVRDRVSGWFTREPDHIAVLHFENVGNDPENDAVSAGLMDSLASRLTNLESGKRSLWVVPASEVRRRKITDPTSAFKELGATVAVAGSLQRDGQSIRMTVNLINTRNLRLIGSAALEDRAGDFASLQDEAVARVAELLKIDVTPEMMQATGRVANAGAYESYLKALGYTEQFDKAGNLDKAIAVLDGALKADPRFALGYAQLCESYRLKTQLDKDMKWLDQALVNCNKAVELNDQVPAVYVTLGHIHRKMGKYDLALQEYQRALQLDPRSSEAWGGIARAYGSAGRVADAEAALRKAIDLRPDYWEGYVGLGLFLHRRQRYDEAIAQYKHALELSPDSPTLYLNVAAVYVDKGDPKLFPEAEQALRKSITMEPTYQAYTNLGYLYIQERKYGDAAAAVEKALQLNDRDYVTWGNLVLAYEALHERDKSSQAQDRERLLLEQAAERAPRDANVQGNLGIVYAKQKLREKALLHIQSALALSPDNADVLSSVGEAYEDLGDRAQALQYIEKSLRKGCSLTSLQADPDLQGLLADPRFRAGGK